MSTRHPREKPKATASKNESAFAQAVKAAGLTVEAGKGAVESRYRGHVASKLSNTQFTGSLNMDEAFRTAEGQTHRWDYGLGVRLPPRTKWRFGWNHTRLPAMER